VLGYGYACGPASAQEKPAARRAPDRGGRPPERPDACVRAGRARSEAVTLRPAKAGAAAPRHHCTATGPTQGHGPAAGLRDRPLGTRATKSPASLPRVRWRPDAVGGRDSPPRRSSSTRSRGGPAPHPRVNTMASGSGDTARSWCRRPRANPRGVNRPRNTVRVASECGGRAATG
jgi:hypothetical protein